MEVNERLWMKVMKDTAKARIIYIIMAYNTVSLPRSWLTLKNCWLNTTYTICQCLALVKKKCDTL